MGYSQGASAKQHNGAQPCRKKETRDRFKGRSLPFCIFSKLPIMGLIQLIAWWTLKDCVGFCLAYWETCVLAACNASNGLCIILSLSIQQTVCPDIFCRKVSVMIHRYLSWVSYQLLCFWVNHFTSLCPAGGRAKRRIGLQEASWVIKLNPQWYQASI